MYVSLVVPLFNSEPYLNKLLSSIRNQSYKKFEVVFVNDGSVDNTQDIINQFIDDYDGEAKIISISNSGSNPARMVGVKNAKYGYIMFADADDFFDDEYVLSFVENYDKELDIISNSCYVNDKGALSKQDSAQDAPILIKKDNYEILKRLYSYNGICDYFWNKLFKKSLFDEVDMSNRMPFEELRTMHKIFEKAKAIKIIDNPHYYYVHRDNSQSARKPMINFYKYDARKERYFYTIANYEDKMLQELIAFRLLDDYIDFVQDESFKMWKKDLPFIKKIYIKNKNIITKNKRLKRHLEILFLAPFLYKFLYKLKNYKL